MDVIHNVTIDNIYTHHTQHIHTHTYTHTHAHTHILHDTKARTIMSTLFNHLRRQIVQCPAESLPSTSRCMHRPTKITNLQFASVIHQNIFRLQISVYNVFGLQEIQSISQLGDIFSSGSLTESHTIAQSFEEFSFGSVFDDKIYAPLIIKVSIQTKNIAVSVQNMCACRCVRVCVCMSVESGCVSSI